MDPVIARVAVLGGYTHWGLRILGQGAQEIPAGSNGFEWLG